MRKQSRVRYLTVARVAIEIVSNLTDSENAQFNRILFSCFKQLENGQPPEYEATDSPLLNVALKEAIGELQEGYETYMKRVTAAQKKPDEPETSQRPINDTSETDQRPTIRKREKEEREKESERLTSEGMQGGRPFNELEQTQLNAALKNAYIYPDPQFWSFAEKAGYRITLEAIRKAAEIRTHEISYVVKLMRDAIGGQNGRI